MIDDWEKMQKVHHGGYLSVSSMVMKTHRSFVEEMNFTTQPGFDRGASELGASLV